MKRSKTVDEFCNSKPGTFKKFIKKKESHLQAIEKEREDRIRAKDRATCELAWAA
jgi:hypothetical protein